MLDPQTSAGRTARDMACAHALRRVRRFPQRPVEALDCAGLSPRDARLANAIDHTVARSFLTLRHVIESRSERPFARLQPHVAAALLVAAAQILYLDRVPDYATVDHAVEWTHMRGSKRAAGFVNAVARAIVNLRGEEIIERGDRLDLAPNHLPLPDGRVRLLSEEIFACEPLARLAQQTGHVAELLTRWKAEFGESSMRRLALHDLCEPPIVINDDPDSSGRGFGLEPHSIAGFRLFDGDPEALARLLDSANIRVQDPASAMGVGLTAKEPVSAGRQISRRLDKASDSLWRAALVADLCAGPGTKTHQILSVHPEARVIASDADSRRLDVLRSRFAGNERVTVIAPAETIKFARQCDLVVLDVPCSNTGVLARRVEARYRFNAATLRDLVSLQRQIIADSLLLLTEGGRLLYTTCSLEREENEEQAAWIESWHPLRRMIERRTMPAGLPGDPTALYNDGGYAAILRPRT